MGSAIEEFNQAVLCSFDQAADPQLRNGATTSLEALKQSSNGWTFCLQALSLTTEDRVKFWCLQTLVDMVQQNRYAALAEPEKGSWRAALMGWAQSKGGAQTDEAPFVKNKFAQLLVSMLKLDYPQHWPDFFQLLLGTLHNGPVSIDIFLRLLNTIHEEVVSSEGSGFDWQLAARIKDGMRDQCLPQIADAWYSILRLHESAPSLAAACLHTIHLYVSWIDITLIACPRFLELFVRFLHRAQLHEGACLCMTEIVSKRMEARTKLEHLASLLMVGLLADAASAGVEVSSPFATLASAVSLELLDCWERLAIRVTPSTEAAVFARQASAQLGQSMPLLLSCLSSPDIEVSQCTMGFLHSYVGRLRKLLPSPKELAEHAEHLQNLLLVMARKSVYREDYCFKCEDEAEETFTAYRREIATLFKGVARVHASLTQAFVHSMLQSTLERVENTPWGHVEVALWLLFQLGEGLPDATIREKDGVFQLMMTALLNSSVSAHPHQAVQLLYFENIVRYYRFFLAQPDFLRRALRSFLDSRGLRNPHGAVRARVCYLLLRFVKQTLKAATLDFLETVRAVHCVLQQQPVDRDEAAAGAAFDDEKESLHAAAPSHSPLLNGGCHHCGNGCGLDNGTEPNIKLHLTAFEQLNLYEVCGLILGAGLASSDQVGEMLEALLKPPLDRLQQLCASRISDSLEKVPEATDAELLLEARAKSVAHCISVVAVVSKGFSNLSTSGHQGGLPRAAFFHAMQLALSALRPYGKFADVRAKALMLLHRMVETLAEDLASFLHPALPQLLADSDAKEVNEVVTLVNQLVLKFKGELGGSVSQLVGPLTNAIFSLVASLDASIAASSSAGASVTAPQSDEVRERRSLLRSYYSFMHSLVHNDLTHVLSDPQNSAHVGAALRALQRGCLEGPDLQIQRQCFVILQRLVDAWGGSDPSFDQYVLHEILPVCFSVFAQPHFSTADATSLPLIESLVSLQKIMLAKLGAGFASYLAEVQLPSIGCSADFSAQYCRLLAEGNVKELAKFVRQQLAVASR